MSRSIIPALPVDAYQTWQMAMPLSTHWRRATCAEVDCEPYLHGWASTFDLGTELGQAQYYYCTHDRTRTPTTEQLPEGLIRLIYPPGTTCFSADKHRVKIDRAPLFVVRHGDWRGNPSGASRVHRNGADWAEDWAGAQDRLAALLQKG